MAWIAGDRVVLRAWEQDDVRASWEASQSTDADGQRLRDWFEPPRSLHDAEQQFESWHAEPDNTTVRLVIQADDRAVGDANLYFIDQRNQNALVGLGIWRAEDRCRGYGTDALHALLRWSFRHLNLHRVELCVEPENRTAVHVYEKLGFVAEGLRREHHFDDGCYRDEQVMGLLRREFEARERAPAT